MMHLDPHLIAPFLAAIVAGALNSAAGGGSFVSFPALLLVGFPADRGERDQQHRDVESAAPAASAAFAKIWTSSGRTRFHRSSSA